MSEIAHSAVGDVPIDSFKADSHNGGKDAWVCTRCGKVKDLRGDHLRGKMEVRSDCWPCGKKATFKLQSRLSDDGSNNNVPAASTVDDTHQPKGVGNATIVGGFRAPVVPSTGDEHQFLFPAPVLQCSTPSLSADCSSVWKCSICGKVKPLSGDHLRGKTEVRSDCWPCGCKRTFVLSPVDGEYGCSALPKEDASKTISKASENVKEQATTGAQIPVQPAAIPFKSVFDTQSSGDAKPPAATPFKSVFDTQSSGDAKPPAATPFKSVFGTQSSGDAKPPAATPFKSVFGTQSSGDAKPPAATPFKSVFDTQSSGDAKPPAATPFKSVFDTQSSGDAKPPAATPFKSVFGTQSSGDAKPPAATPFKSVFDTQSSGDAKPPAATPFKSVFGTQSSGDAKPPAATPFKSVFDTQSSGDAKPPAATPFKSDSINGFFIKQTRAGIMSEIAHSAVGDVPIDSFKADSHNGGKDAWVCTRCGKVKDLRGDHLRGKMEVRSDCWPCGKKATFKLQSRLSDDGSNNNVPAASTVDDTHQPKGVGNATIVGGFRAPVVPSTGDEHQFLFPAPVLQCSTPSLSADCSSVWKCSTCGKVKPLSGDHLRGKTEVRSDCWPCGCKRTFVLSPVDGEYGCSALPKEDASKTISKASENVKEQATTGAQIPVQPAAIPFKSVFDTQSSGDAKPPAATPFKSVFGTQSSGDAKPPAATPFKSVFGTQSSGDAKPPAATPFKSVFGTQSSGDAKPPAATPFKSDSINGFFIKQTRAGIMSEIAHSAVGDVPIDSFKADSHNGGKDAWVCTRCGKVKDLRGDHLRGKMEVRSDCWPCGKKATFKLQSRLSDDGSNNNVPAASTVDDTHQPKGVGNATIVGGFRAPVVPSTGDEHQFLFPAPVLQCSTPSLSADCSSVWKCSTCGKVKPLSGDHLRGKTEVRSDCWPCGCKRTFVLSPVDGEYGCSALPKEDASKTISKASENVKEQATTGAQIPVQPAATPFKSVFDTQSSGDAKPPAATPFKSVFGTQSSGDAKPPAATPFKSVFGTQSSGDAKPPAATPFKSVFDTQSSGDAKPPAATPFKSVFGTQSSGDAKPPAATPFKSVFDTQSSGDAKPPAATPFKSVFGTQSSGDAKPPAATPFKSVFGTQSSGDAKPPAATPFKSVFGTQSSGDAKPPAATPFKSVFDTQSSGDAKPPAATPFKSVFDTQSSGDAKPPAATPFKSVFGTQSSGDAKPPAATPFKSVFGTQSSGDAKPPAATPFKSVFGTQSSGDAKPPAATPFKSVFGTQSSGDAKPPAATPFKSVFGTQSSGDANCRGGVVSICLDGESSVTNSASSSCRSTVQANILHDSVGGGVVCVADDLSGYQSNSLDEALNVTGLSPLFSAFERMMNDAKEKVLSALKEELNQMVSCVGGRDCCKCGRAIQSGREVKENYRGRNKSGDKIMWAHLENAFTKPY
ncbi:hypothetical protein, conserved [Trypanosoma brucei brucei TREU927]|uniref:Uncharacterized protein n=1 Tax=Trypanosoma brucei brucei (strain 927/4 GUTat10.1) TaxID=185431 RepID=Q383H0_TRYB2|nr:hypothetical protein, conserved [Trypanosoma brucei brucei TREU927]EAN80061.1 hypothetical protein, conserved [Trypanosoma brucei brucei TREU927]